MVSTGDRASSGGVGGGAVRGQGCRGARFKISVLLENVK